MKIIQEKINWKSNSQFDKNNPEVSIIHHAVSKDCTIHDINDWHRENGWNGCGYHYFIRKNGSVYEGRKQSWNGCHTKGMNNKSIGICLEGCYTDYKNITEKQAPEAQINALVDLLIYINLPFTYHRDYTKEKDCPGKYFITRDELQKITNEKIRAKTKIIDENIKWMKETKLIEGNHNSTDNLLWNEFAVVLKRYDSKIEIMSNRIKVLEKLVSTNQP